MHSKARGRTFAYTMDSEVASTRDSPGIGWLA